MNQPLRFSFRSFSGLCIAAAVCAALFLNGCAALGVVAHALPPATVQPKYAGIINQSVGVMVWADKGIRIDWPMLQLDLANSIQNRMAACKDKRYKNTTYPVRPASIVRYQQDHPEIEAMNIEEYAAKLGVSRLVYVEIEDFATRSVMSVDLFRGHASATVRMVEIDHGHAKVAFELNDIQAVYPKKSPPEGMPGIGDNKIYAGLIDAFATNIAHVFTPYQPDDDE